MSNREVILRAHPEDESWSYEIYKYGNTYKIFYGTDDILNVWDPEISNQYLLFSSDDKKKILRNVMNFLGRNMNNAISVMSYQKDIDDSIKSLFYTKIYEQWPFTSKKDYNEYCVKNLSWLRQIYN